MFLLENATGTGAAQLLGSGPWRLSADIAAGNAAVITYEESNTPDGPWVAIKQGGAAIQSDVNGGSFIYEASSNFVRAIATGGTACSVRAVPVAVS